MSETGKSKQSGCESEKGADKHFGKGLARAFGGAIIFTLPMLMTMEMWRLASISKGIPSWSVWLRYTIVGYSLVLLISLYILWTFGRTNGQSFHQILSAVVVLGFPASVGAASARLIL